MNSKAVRATGSLLLSFAGGDTASLLGPSHCDAAGAYSHIHLLSCSNVPPVRWAAVVFVVAWVGYFIEEQCEVAVTFVSDANTCVWTSLVGRLLFPRMGTGGDHA